MPPATRDPLFRVRSTGPHSPSTSPHRTARVALAAGCFIAISTGFAGGSRQRPSQPAAATAPVAPADSLRDPDLAAGILPNGMHYYIRVNRSPAHRAEFRFAVNAGSVLEDHDQRGFAHFLEHMAFKGTTHFPHDSLVDFIETSGMRFGADLNAETTQDETVYRFELPTDDPAIVEQGLQILQDWASGGMRIDSTGVVSERGVIMGEWRFRSLVDSVTADYRAHYDSLWFGRSRYVRRQPIGDTTLIETAEPGPIRRFYHDWYRPDLMAIVVVGDFDLHRMVQEVTRRFGRIPARRHERKRVQPRVPIARQPVVDVYRGRVSPSVEVLWPVPRTPSGTRAALQHRLVAQLLWQHLRQRLRAIRESPSRPFITASLERGRVVRPIHVEGFRAVAWPDSLQPALAAMLTELQRVARHGVPEAALDREKAELLRGLEGAAGSAVARPSSAYADAYVRHFLTGDGTLLGPVQKLAFSRGILPTITSAALARAARDLWRSHAGERILVDLPLFSHVATPTRAGILALVDSVARAPIPAERDTAAAASPLLARLPAPGRITHETRDTVAGITEWTLSNGARVILKPTSNDPDQLLVRAWSPGGFSRMPDSLFFSPGRMVAKLMTQAAGLGTHSHDALQRRFRTTGIRSLRVHIGYADESIDLSGSPRDRESLFQLLYLQFTAPAFDTAAIHSWASLARYEGNGATIQDQINQIFARGEPRLWPVSTQLAQLLRPREALAAYENRFGNAGDFTFILVGSITPREARPLVERYLASLPSTGAHETPKPLDVKPFYERIDNTMPVLTVPKALTSILFDGPFPSTPDTYLPARQQLDALATVLQDRIRLRIREQLGGDYSPYITAFTYALPEVGQPVEHFRVLGGFMSAPERMQALWTACEDVLDSVRAHGVTRAELARAATIERRQHETALESNAYWVNAIEMYNRLGIPLRRILDPYGRTPPTPAEMRAAARRYLPRDVYIHITEMPRDSTSYPRPDTAAAASAPGAAPRPHLRRGARSRIVPARTTASP